MGLGSVWHLSAGLSYVCKRMRKLKSLLLGAIGKKCFRCKYCTRCGTDSNQNRTDIKIVSDVDFNHMEVYCRCIQNCQPDIMVNSSRAYSGLKYGKLFHGKK